MTYNKPEVTVLGDAASLILSGSGSHFETGSSKQQSGGPDTDGELDD